MAIDTEDLFDIKATKYAAGAGSADFLAAFLNSMLRVCEDLKSPKVGITIDTIPTTVDINLDIDDEYYSAVFDGLDYYIPQYSFWAQKDERDMLAIYNKRLAEAHTFHLDETTHYTRMGQIDD